MVRPDNTVSEPAKYCDNTHASGDLGVLSLSNTMTLRKWLLVFFLLIGIAACAQPKASKRDTGKWRRRERSTKPQQVARAPANDTGPTRIALIVTGQVFRLTSLSIDSLAERLIKPQLLRGACVDVFATLAEGTVVKSNPGAQDKFQHEMEAAEVKNAMAKAIQTVAEQTRLHGVHAGSGGQMHAEMGANSSTLIQTCATAPDAALVAWDLHPDLDEHTILKERFDLSFKSTTTERTSQRRRNVKFFDNLLRAHDNFLTARRKLGTKYQVVIRSRSDNVYLTDHLAYTSAYLLRRLNGGLLSAGCHRRDGLNDKFAVMDEASAAVYMRALELRKDVIAHDPDHSYTNPESLLSRLLNSRKIRKLLFPAGNFQLAHALWDASIQRLCFRRVSECTTGDIDKFVTANQCEGITNNWNKLAVMHNSTSATQNR